MGFDEERKKRLEGQLRKIARDNNATNKRIILGFYEASICKPNAMIRKLQCMEILVRLSGKNLNRLNAKDFKNIFENIERKYKPQTTFTYIGITKQFCKWFERGRYWPFVSWKVRHRPKCSIKSSDMITEDELKRMIEAAPNLMWKAFIQGFAFSRCRPGEFVSLRRKDVAVKDGEIILSLNGQGKNMYSPREIIVLEDLPHFRQYLEGIQDPEQFLFPQKWSYTTYKVNFDRIVRKAGITRRIWFYLFRHSRYTKDWELGMRSETRNALYGHSATTKMNEYYLHLNQQSLRDDLYKVHNGNGNGHACAQGETRIIMIAPALMYGYNN